MNHMSVGGNVNQYVRSDYGEFIKIGDNFRFRKDLIISYCVAEKLTDDPKGRESGLLVCMSARSFGVPMNSREEAEKEIERLDWIFRKDAHEEKINTQELRIE